MSDPVTGHLRTTSDANKAFEQFDELRNKHTILRAVVIAQTEGEHFHVLGHVSNPDEIALLLMVASQALAAVPQHLRDQDGVSGEAVIGERVGDPEPAAEPPPGPPAGRGIRTLAAHWARMEAVVFADESKDARRDYRRTFYCGALTLFELINGSLDPRSVEPTERDVNFLNELNAELQDFREQIIREESAKPPSAPAAA